MIPHEHYMQGDACLSSHGNNRPLHTMNPYPPATHGTLPILSTVGRGPRGIGITAKVLTDTAGNFSFGIYDDESGELIFQTPNLATPAISISQPEVLPNEGEYGQMDVHVGGTTYSLSLPPGSHGSRLYVMSSDVEKTSDDTYSVAIQDLTHYGRSVWNDKPDPRVGDVVVTNTIASGSVKYLTFGTVVAVNDGNVVFTARTFHTYPAITMSEDGEWLVDGVPTGIIGKGTDGAKGDKGDKGDQGIQGIQGERGPQGKKGDQGDQGEKGDQGLPAVMEIGTVTQTTGEPYASIRNTSIPNNTYALDLRLPRGADGKSLNIQGGVYTVDQLPEYDETPVNTAYIVKDSDTRFDLYIRGVEPVIAEEGGPWTVVEDWQGVHGFSVRFLTDLKIPETDELRITIAEAQQYITPWLDILDGDLLIDQDLRLGSIGSAEDNSGDYSVRFVAKLGIAWENVNDKPFESLDEWYNVEDGVLMRPDLYYGYETVDGVEYLTLFGEKE